MFKEKTAKEQKTKRSSGHANDSLEKQKEEAGIIKTMCQAGERRIGRKRRNNSPGAQEAENTQPIPTRVHEAAKTALLRQCMSVLL